MYGQSAIKRWEVVTVLVLFILVSCGPAADTTRVPESASPRIVATTTPEPKLEPPGCYGLFVDVEDNYVDPTVSSPYFSMYPLAIKERGGLQFSPRLYVFDAGEPIVVHTAIVVLGEGGLVVVLGNLLRRYEMTIVDQQGGVLAMTEKGEQAAGKDVPNIGGNLVDRDTPHMEIFRIDEWFDLSRPGFYTLTLSTEIYISGEPYQVTGNPVMIKINP